MSLDTEQPAEQNSAMPPAMTPLGRDFYEQLLALADTIGAAYADAYRQIGAAYAEACRDGPAASGPGAKPTVAMRRSEGVDSAWSRARAQPRKR